MMKLIALTLGLLTFACVAPQTPDPNKYRQDDLFCWVRNDDGRWIARGLRKERPPGTVYTQGPPR